MEHIYAPQIHFHIIHLNDCDDCPHPSHNVQRMNDSLGFLCFQANLYQNQILPCEVFLPDVLFLQFALSLVKKTVAQRRNATKRKSQSLTRTRAYRSAQRNPLGRRKRGRRSLTVRSWGRRRARAAAMTAMPPTKTSGGGKRVKVDIKTVNMQKRDGELTRAALRTVTRRSRRKEGLTATKSESRTRTETRTHSWAWKRRGGKTGERQERKVLETVLQTKTHGHEQQQDLDMLYCVRQQQSCAASTVSAAVLTHTRTAFLPTLYIPPRDLWLNLYLLLLISSFVPCNNCVLCSVLKQNKHLLYHFVKMFLLL